ncbi:hypothetical protein JVX91_03465 [Pseudomonas sp. PDNC002]|uniref:hypothetical protein n=1 Tax=Pseudomonas sp. PDNC002 TaxID=2811422 RepID=UPI0019649D69|nr:hypothetical protein [Pseudomonas sp. PDNC002]QRY80193.1 hypothetical protein JVX91_03465 [Pseudomonas sp. PDNC002]
MLRDTPSSSKDWTLDELEEAYQLGLDSGLRGRYVRQSFYYNAVLAAGWEAGCEDGLALLWQTEQRRRREGTRLMTLHLRVPSDHNSRTHGCLAGSDYSL